MNENIKTVKEIRHCHNYQLDFLKLVFALCVFVFHSRILSEKGHWIRLMTDKWGFISVHFFFAVSGMLMISSFMSKENGRSEKCGKETLKFVFHKFKGIAFPYYAAFIISFGASVAIEVLNGGSFLKSLGDMFIKSIPEMFLLQNSGISPIEINTAAWYLSSMLICLLFLNYLLRKNSDFFIYVFSPLAGLLLLGYFYSSGQPISPFRSLTGYVNSGLLRGVCGICFGSVSWLISEFLKKRVITNVQRGIVTAAEIVLSLIFAIIWFTRNTDEGTYYPIILLMPVIIGIIFSDTSFIRDFFQSKIFRNCGKLSLIIYLNHFVPYRIVQKLEVFRELTYKERFGYMVIFTCISILLYFILMKIFKVVAEKVSVNTL